MKITVHQPDEDGVITIKNCLTIVVMGLRDDQPTVWAVTDPKGKKGDTLEYVCKYEDDDVTMAELTNYRGSLMNTSVAWHLFGKDNSPKPVVGKDGKSVPGKVA